MAKKREPAGAPEPAKGRKERMTVHLPVDLIERAKNIVFWTPGLTLAQLATEGFSRVVEAYEKDHGKPYPLRKQPLKGGRPMK